MTSVIQALESIDLSKLTVHLEAANGTVSGSVSIGGLNPQELLGPFGDVLKAVQGGLPSKPEDIVAAITKGMGDLGSLIDIPELRRVVEVAASLDDLVKLLTQAGELIGKDPGVIIDKLLQEFGGELGSLEKILEDLIGRFANIVPTELPAELKAPVKALEALAAGLPQDAAGLVQVLGPFVLGVDLAVLGAPIDRLNQFLAQIGNAGGDLNALRQQMLALTVKANATTAMIVAPDADMAVVSTKLAEIRSGLDPLLTAVESALSRLGTDLGSLDPGRFGRELAGFVDPLLAMVPQAIHDAERAMVAPLRALVEEIEGLDGAALRALFTDAQSRMAQAAESIGLNEMTRAIESLFDFIIDQIERVPMRRMRDELLGALIGLDAKIRGFLGFSLPHELTAKLGELEHAIQSIDLSAIHDRVNQLKQAIEDAVDKFPIAAIKEELGKVVAAVTDVIKGFTPAMQQVADQLDKLAEEIDSIDIEGAGQASMDAIHAIRQKVQDLLTSDDIPDAAKSVLGVAAHELRQLDIAGTVTAPFQDALAKIDVSVILAPVEAGMGKVREVLHKVTPQALIDQLDEPFDALLAELGKLKPEALLGGITGAFGDLMNLLQNADPRVLVAPLEAEFQKLVQKIRDLIDPAPLFKPLRDGYQKILELIDIIDLGKLFGALMGKLADVPNQLTSKAKAAVAGKTGAALPGLDGSGAFKFGDILRPVAVLVAKVRQKLVGLTESLLGEALGLLSAPLALLGSLVDPARGVAAQIASAVSDRRALVDPFASQGPLADLRRALGGLDVAASGLSADARLALGNAAIEIKIDTRLTGLAGASAAVDEQLHRMHAAAAPPQLNLALSRLSGAFSQGPAGALASLDPTAGVLARINLIFDALDPTPLAVELDVLGDRIQAKLGTLKNDLIEGFLDLLYGLLKTFLPITPYGLSSQLSAGMARIKEQVAVLNPAVFEDEIRHLLDGVLSALNPFSPAALAGELGKLFDSVLAKLNELNPATLLGDLNPVAAAIAKLEELRPSVVLAPMVAETQDLQAALEQIADFKLGGSVEEAAKRLLAQLDLIIEKVEQELNALLDALEGGGGQEASGGDISVSAG